MSYKLIRESIRDGSVLLRRAGRDPADLAIAVAGQGLYAHAAMAAWWRDNLMCVETRQFTGGRAVTLSSQVADEPGQWDVYDLVPFEPAKSVKRYMAVVEMVRLCGIPYGWRSLLAVAARHLPILRDWVKPLPDDAPAARTRPPFCSEAVGRAWDLAGVDFVPEKPHSITEPSDLARSARLVYQFTLAP